MDIINQRSSKNIAILVLFHYIFTLLVLFFPTGLRASPLPDNQPADAASYILYQKPQGQSWREVGSQLAPQISDIERWQRDLAEQYGLNFSTSTFLLPADARLAQMYPQVTLVAVARQENLDDFAWRYQLSRQQLINLNRSLKTPHQLADLAGQWVIVPEQLPAAKAENSAAAEKLRDILGSFWQSAQQHGAVSSARSQVASTANASLTAEVENWLKRSGARARVTADLGLDKGSSTDFGLDYLYPFFTGEDDTLFVQLNGHRWNDRNMLNVGLGWRHNFNSQLMGGANAFYDQDITRHHSRLGAGLELWSERLHGSANYYLPLSDWRRSDAPFLSDSDHYVLNERAASGWDLNLEAALARTLSGWAGIYQWYGEKVDVNGSRSQASKDPYGLNLGVKWQPVPLVTLRSEQQFISGQNSNFNVGVDLRWEFGRSLAEMLDTDKAQALPSLLASRTEFVHRNNNIVLAYQQQQKSWHIYFDPAELTTQAGSAAFIHGVKGAGGAHVVYRSAQPNTAAVESTTGRVTPLQTGETTISAELYAAVNDAKPAAVAQYRLTVLPGEFAPSVSDVQIQGESVIGNTLKGSYRYHANQGEAESGSVLQWFHARDLSQPLASGDSYQVSARDIDQTLVFQVIPQNKKNIRGDAATAQIAGPTVKLAAMRFEPLDHGIKVDDATVKFLKSQRGKIQFLVKALDGQGRPLADRPVWWRQNNNALGALSEVQTRTDANGLATVMLENITSAGQDEIIASLQKSASAYAADEAHVEARSPLTVIQVQPEITLTVKDNVQQVPVASVPLTFQLALEEEDLLGVANRPIRWQSNGKPAGASVTDDAGLAAIELPVPEVYGNGEWRIEAVLADVNRQASLSLTLQKNPVPALAVKDVTLSWGEVAPALQVTGGNNSNYQYRSDDNKVVAVDEQGLLTVNGTGSTTITVSQQATETQLAPAPATATVTVNKAASTALSAQPVSVTYGDAPQTLKVNGGNGGEKSYSSDNPGVVTIDSSGLLTFTGAGSTTITVSQQATETQLAPAPATATVTVNKAASTALSAQPVSVTYGDAPQTLKVNGGNGGEKSYSSDNPGVVTIDSIGLLTFTGAGSAMITVSQAETETQKAPADLRVAVDVGMKAPAKPQPVGADGLGATYTVDVSMLGLRINDINIDWKSTKGYRKNGNDQISNGIASFVAQDPVLLNSELYVEVSSKSISSIKPGKSPQTAEIIGIPLISSVSVSPSATAPVNTGIKASYTGFDAQGTGADDSRYQWYWRKTGSNDAWQPAQKDGNTAQTFVTEDSYVGYDVRVGVTPKGKNQTVQGEEVFSNAVSIYGTPSITSVSVSPSATAIVKAPLQASYTGFNAQGTGADDSRYQWYWRKTGSNDVWQPAQKDGNTSKTFVTDVSYAGYEVRVGVTPVGSAKPDEPGTEVFSQGVAIVRNTSPALVAQPVSTTYGSRAQTLLVSGGNGAGVKSYRSDKPQIVSVSNSGELTFIAAGSAKITVSQTATDTYDAPASIEVAVDVGIKTPPKPAPVGLGGLNATYNVDVSGLGLPNDDINIVWKSTKGYSWQGNSELSNGKATFRAWDTQLLNSKLYIEVSSKSVPSLAVGISPQTDEILAPPSVTDVSISPAGIAIVGQPLTAEYRFNANGNGSDASTFQWYWRERGSLQWNLVSDTPDAKLKTFTPPRSYGGREIQVRVTPKTAIAQGTEVSSSEARIARQVRIDSYHQTWKLTGLGGYWMYYVKVRVVDVATGKPVPGISVYFRQTHVGSSDAWDLRVTGSDGTTSDADGYREQASAYFKAWITDSRVIGGTSEPSDRVRINGDKNTWISIPESHLFGKVLNIDM